MSAKAPQNVRFIIGGRTYPCDVLRDPDQDSDGCAAWIAVPREELPPLSDTTTGSVKIGEMPGKTVVIIRVDKVSIENKENDHEG